MVKVTIADVAKEAGVSTMTVSRVINNKGEISPVTRKRVQGVIDRLGYQPSAIARSLSTNRTQTFGLVVPDITNPFFPGIVRGAEDTATAQGYSIILCNTVENLAREQEALELLEGKRVDGVVVCSARLPDAELLLLIKRHPAAVLFNRPALNGVSGSVQVDDAYGAMCAVQHLVAAGRQTIGFLSGPPYSYSGQRRALGFTAALEAAGYAVAPELQAPCSPTEGGGYQAARKLLTDNPEIDGLVCYNDLVAIGVLQACAALGVGVPEDVAVVGCDDIRMASLIKPSLTTLRVSKYQLGQRLVRMLLDRLENREGPESVLVKPELITRESAP